MPRRVTQEVLEELAGAIKLTPMTSEHKEPQVQGHQKWRLMKILSTQEGLLQQRLISPALLLVDILSIDWAAKVSIPVIINPSSKRYINVIKKLLVTICNNYHTVLFLQRFKWNKLGSQLSKWNVRFFQEVDLHLAYLPSTHRQTCTWNIVSHKNFGGQRDRTSTFNAKVWNMIWQMILIMITRCF